MVTVSCVGYFLEFLVDYEFPGKYLNKKSEKSAIWRKSYYMPQRLKSTFLLFFLSGAINLNLPPLEGLHVLLLFFKVCTQGAAAAARTWESTEKTFCCLALLSYSQNWGFDSSHLPLIAHQLHHSNFRRQEERTKFWKIAKMVDFIRKRRESSKIASILNIQLFPLLEMKTLMRYVSLFISYGT